MQQTRLQGAEGKEYALGLLKDSFAFSVKWEHSDDFLTDAENCPVETVILEQDLPHILEMLEAVGVNFVEISELLSKLYKFGGFPKVASDFSIQNRNYFSYRSELISFLSTCELLDLCKKGNNLKEEDNVHLRVNKIYDEGNSSQYLLCQRAQFNSNAMEALIYEIKDDRYGLKAMAKGVEEMKELWENHRPADELIMKLSEMGTPTDEVDLLKAEWEKSLLSEQVDVLVCDYCYLTVKLALEKQYLIKRTEEERLKLQELS